MQALKQNSSVNGPTSKFRINCNLSRLSWLSDMDLCSSGPANKVAACAVDCNTAESNPCRRKPSSGNSSCWADRFCITGTCFSTYVYPIVLTTDCLVPLESMFALRTN